MFGCTIAPIHEFNTVPMHQSTIAPKHQCTKAQMHQATMHWCIRDLMLWCIPAVVHAVVQWGNGAMLVWCICALVQWCNGAMLLCSICAWCDGAFVQWCFGALVICYTGAVLNYCMDVMLQLNITNAMFSVGDLSGFGSCLKYANLSWKEAWC